MFERLAHLDGLTSIPNRRAFDQTLGRECQAARRMGSSLSLLMIDVDYFKQVNDQLGHLMGDEYLVCVARTLLGGLPRSTDFAARYGGEEFAVILPGTDAEGAWKTAERLRMAVNNLSLLHPGSPLGRMSVSVGVATAGPTGNEEAGWLKAAADEALYRAKSNGRNRVERAMQTG
jgi:diguanylate cyclase (GGDEF)-like protein